MWEHGGCLELFCKVPFQNVVNRIDILVVRRHGKEGLKKFEQIYINCTIVFVVYV